MSFEKIRGLVELGFLVPPHDGMQNYTRMKFLHDSVARFAQKSTGVALEIGCYRAGSTVYLAKACLRKQIDAIYAIDLFTGTPSWNQPFDTFETARKRLEDYKLDRNVTLIRAHSLEYQWQQPVDVLHIDADHEYEAVWADIDKYSPFVTQGGVIVFDDYDAAHPGVKKAVNRLLSEQPQYEIVAINYEGREYGSICVRNG